jgi:hypothetical protein
MKFWQFIVFGLIAPWWINFLKNGTIIFNEDFANVGITSFFVSIVCYICYKAAPLFFIDANFYAADKDSSRRYK